MTELQRRAQQPDASFGDELSRVGPRIVDWATLATYCSRVTAPHIAFEGFTNTTARVPESWHPSNEVEAAPSFFQRLHSRVCCMSTPVRAGFLAKAAPGLKPSLSFGLGAGGRSLSVDGEITVDPVGQRFKHCTVNEDVKHRRQNSVRGKRSAAEPTLAVNELHRLRPVM